MTACSEFDGTPDAPAGSLFQLDSVPLLSRTTVELSEECRDSPAERTDLWGSGRLVRVDPAGRTPVDGAGELVCVPATDYGEQPDPAAVLLGVVDGTGYWALRVGPGDDRHSWRDLRTAGALLGDTDANLLTTAMGLLGWHDRARYCAVCGATTAQVRGGWARQCSGCDREEYPRTDPSMICLVHDGGDRVLLARQANWPAERFSVLAGFVEVGESLEHCVRREVFEEVGVAVTGVRYLGSQPWPFPRSLMVGFTAVAAPEQPLRPAEAEIAEAHWIDREHVRAAMEADGPVRGLRLPPGISIAHRMLRGWAYWTD